MILLHNPTYPIRKSVQYTTGVGHANLTELRDIMVQYLIMFNDYTAEELENLLRDEDIYVTQSSGWHSDDAWELELEAYVDEPEATFMVRVENYNTNKKRYDEWYAGNKEEIDAALEQREQKKVENKEKAKVRREKKRSDVREQRINKLQKELDKLKETV